MTTTVIPQCESCLRYTNYIMTVVLYGTDFTLCGRCARGDKDDYPESMD